MLDTGCWIPDTGCQMPDAGCQMPDAGICKLITFHYIYIPMKQSVKIKICGIRNIEDAIIAIHYGADEIGFLIGQEHPSDDFISCVFAESISAEIQDKAVFRIVTHYSDADKILDLIYRTGIKNIQLHGKITIDLMHILLNERPDLDVRSLLHIQDVVPETENEIIKLSDSIILDTYNPETDQVGGTGFTHDWELSAEFIRKCRRPVWLAGGLDPENVYEAIKITKPYGVDVNSGVKGKSGNKDAEKIKQFVTNSSEINY